jgi:hypothetical protein
MQACVFLTAVELRNLPKQPCRQNQLSMRTTLPFMFSLLVCFLTSQAQQRRSDDTSHYRNEPIPDHLRPIERGYGSSAFGSVYYYGGKRLSSPYSLEIPFYEVNDPIVTHHFKSFRTLTSVSRLTSLATLVYIIFDRQRGGVYWTVYGGSIVASVALALVANGHVNKAVVRYNELLRQPRVGLSVAPVPLTGQAAIGAGVSLKF